MQVGNAAPGSGSAPFPRPRWRRGAMIGHRLTSGYMTAHGPGQPCVLCGAGPEGAQRPAGAAGVVRT